MGPRDNDIIRRVMGGDLDAFEILVKRYKHMVFGIVKKHVPISDIDETSQDVFIRAYQSLNTFKGHGGFKSWLSAIAVRTCYDFWRKHYRSREWPVSTLSASSRKWMNAVLSEKSMQAFRSRQAHREAIEVLRWMLDRLSAEDRMVIELVFLEGLSIKETARLLGWSVSKVKIRSYRSRKKMKKLLCTAP